jgi:glucokinase
MVEPAFIGIDLGGTVLKVVATNDDGVILASKRAATAARDPRDELVAQIARLVQDVRSELGRTAPSADVKAAGLAVPGVVDAPAGRVEFTVALNPEWNGFAARDALEEHINVPTLLLNDAQAATLGEHAQGGGRGYRDFVCVTVGTGIGGGLVLDGRLYVGSRGMSGVLGHTTVIPDGLPCLCGNRGCLETVASGTAILRAARTAREAGELTGSSDRVELTVKELAVMAQNGNNVATRIFADAGTALGIALGNVVCTLNPAAIVVGGGVSRAGALLLGPMREEIARRTSVFSPQRGGVDVIQSPLGDDAGAIGSAMWARQGER